MSFSPENSAIKMNPELEQALKNASHEEIKDILNQAAVDQMLVRRDVYSPDVLIPVEPGTAPRQFVRHVAINGVRHLIEGNSEAELSAAEVSLYRRQFGGHPANKDRNDAPAELRTNTNQPRDTRGQFTSEEDGVEASRQADLELRWRRGEISSDVYLAESGALDRALTAQGINPEALREVSGQQVQQRWVNATQEFMAGPGRDWPGGNRNVRLMGEALIAMGVEGEPSAANLAAAYDFLKEKNLLVENEQLALETRIAEAKSPSELQAVLQTPERREAMLLGGSGIFGR